MSFSPKIIAATAVLGLSMAVTGVFAQDAGSMSPTPASSSMGHMGSGMKHDKMMHKMMNDSMHKMPATVTTADAKTGMVEVETEGMALKVHFPPATMSSLKAGDKITLHMGFSKP